jgi:Mn2+/Fe2+ NRAMP family transporter
MIADVDAPSVITAAQSGLSYRFHLLFPLLVLIPILYLVQEMTARLGLTTHKGHAELIREVYGPFWATLSVLSMVTIDLLAYIGEFAGLAFGGLMLGIPPVISVALALLAHTVIVLSGRYRVYERLAIAVSLVLFVFVLAAVLARPNLTQLLAGLSPLQPYQDPGYLFLLAANIGAVIMPWMLFYQQASLVDKGLSARHLREERAETFIGAVVSELLMVSIVIAVAAAAPHVSAGPGTFTLERAAAAAFGAGFGDGGTLFAVGLIAAGFLALVVISLSSGWAWSELFRWPRSLNFSLRRAWKFYAIYLLEVVPAALITLLSPSLIGLALSAMVLNVIVLVIPLVFIVRLSSNRQVLGDLVNSVPRRIALWLIVVVIFVLGMVGAVQGLWH